MSASPPVSSKREWLEAARHSGFLSRLPDDLVNSFLARSERVEYPAGSITLQWEGSPRPAIVLRGAIRIFLSAPDGSQLTLRYLRVGDLLGWTNLHMTRGVQALVDSELLLLQISFDSMIAQENLVVAAALREETRHGLNELLRMTCVRAFGSVRTRVANGLVEHASVTDSLHDGGQIALTQEDLANSIGSVREVVAHTLQALKRDGIIAIQRGRLTILDSERLGREADVGLGLRQS